MELSLATSAQVFLLLIGVFLAFFGGFFRSEVKQGVERNLLTGWTVFWAAFSLFYLGLFIYDLHEVAMS